MDYIDETKYMNVRMPTGRWWEPSWEDAPDDVSEDEWSTEDDLPFD